MLPKAIQSRFEIAGLVCTFLWLFCILTKLSGLQFTQYKKLAQANEEALLRVEDAHNRYKEEVMVLSLAELICFFIVNVYKGT
jgi:hypothetical protein